MHAFGGRERTRSLCGLARQRWIAFVPVDCLTCRRILKRRSAGLELGETPRVSIDGADAGSGLELAAGVGNSPPLNVLGGTRPPNKNESYAAADEE